MNRIEAIETRLRTTFPDAQIRVRDDSTEHIGHVGHGGAGHFTVYITSAAFRGLNRVARHRLVNQALTELMGPEIHALSIQAELPGA